MLMPRRFTAVLVALAGATLVPATLVSAAAVNPYPAVDTTFGSHGFTHVRLPGPNWASDVAVSGKRTYVVGSSSNGKRYSWGTVTALDSTGHVVPSFGSGGSVTLGKAWIRLTAVAVQSDGRVVVAGTIGTELAVVRLRANGALDRTFGVRGWERLKVGPGYAPGYSVKLAIDSTGRVVVAFTRYKGKSDWNSQAYLTRLTSGGRIDRHFGLRHFSNGYANVVAGLALDASDRPLLEVARYSPRTPNASGLLFRLRSNGTRMTSFGGTGYVLVKAGGRGGTALTGVSVDPLGLITAGFTGYTTSVIGAERFSPNGSLDPTFGSGTGRFATTCNKPCGVESQMTPDGLVFVGAVYRNGTPRRLYLARVLPDGSALDPAFGVSGQWTVSAAPTGYEFVGGAALDGSTLIAVGGIQHQRSEDGLVTRFLLAP